MLNGKRLDPPDLGRFHENRIKFPLDELAKYAGQFIAWSPDGLHILASAETMEAMEEKLITAGIDPSQTVGDYVDPY
jgi:hypothetical protein